MGDVWWQNVAVLVGALGGLEFIKWVFNRRTERRLNDLEIKQKEFELDERRITELHASIDKANELNDNLLQRISNVNAALDKHIDRNRELSDRLYRSEQEVNRVNNLLTDEQRKTARYEKRVGALLRLVDHYREWRCEKGSCGERQPPNPKLRGRTYCQPEKETTSNIYKNTNKNETEDEDNKVHCRALHGGISRPDGCGCDGGVQP